MTEEQPLRYLSAPQAAAYRGIPYNTFRYHVQLKQGPRIAAFVGREALYLPADLDIWVQEDRRPKRADHE